LVRDAERTTGNPVAPVPGSERGGGSPLLAANVKEMMAVLLFIVAMLQAQAAPLAPPRDTPKPSPARTSYISGRVTDRDTGQPLRRIAIRLNLGGREPMSFETATNADGRYELRDLPAGEYYVSASPDEFSAGYGYKTFGAVEGSSGFNPAPPLVLKAGESRTDIDFALARMFAIEGRVLNEFGEPMADMTVAGERVERPGGSQKATSDDHGDFRIYAVSPGSWRVCATPSSGGFDNPTAGNVLQLRFAKSCSPAVIVKGSDVGGVIVQMQRERAYTLSGLLVDESSSPIEKARVTIEREGMGSTVAFPEVTRGGFVVRGLTPGKYVIVASVEEPHDPYSLPTSSVGPRQLGHATVTIDASDVSGFVVPLTRGVTVSGRIVFETDRKPPIRGSLLRAQARRDTETQRRYRNLMTPISPVRDDFTFELTGVYGPLMFGVSGLPAGWILKSARHGDRNITDTPTEFNLSGDAPVVELTVTNRTAAIVARPVDDTGRATTNAAILFGPRDPAGWKLGIVGHYPLSADGTVSIRMRPPGEYLIAAVAAEDVAHGRTRTDDDLKAIAERAQPIVLREGPPPLADVRVVKLREIR
jgi:hypothetical protein